MYGQSEAVLKERQQHWTLHPLSRRIALCFGLNIEAVGRDPGRAAGDLISFRLTGKLDQRTRRDVSHAKSPGNDLNIGLATGSGVETNGCDLELVMLGRHRRLAEGDHTCNGSPE